MIMACEPGLYNDDTSALGALSQQEILFADAEVRNISAVCESGDVQQSINLPQMGSPPVHEYLIGRSSKVKVEQRIKNGCPFQAAVKMFEPPVTEKYKQFVRVCKRLRCPFLVPIIKVIDEPCTFQLISPYMPGGSLKTRLSRGMSRAEMITIVYQISEAMVFLHDRNIVHGDINCHHVLFDRNGIARLVDYGMYTHETVETGIQDCRAGASSAVSSKKCFRNDLYSFAEIILHMMKPSVSKQSLVFSALNNLAKQQSFESIREYFDQRVWPELPDRITSETFQVLLMCCDQQCHRTTSRNLNKRLKKIMELFKPALSLIPPVALKGKEYPDCLYCSVQPVHPEHKLRSTSCPETCPYLRACSSCMMKFGSYCHVENDVCEHGGSFNSGYVEFKCPVHSNCTLEPMIGGVRSFAIILRYINGDIADETQNDAMSMIKLASHPKIMRIPFKNIRKIDIDRKKMQQTIQCIEEARKQILHGRPSYFFFYYTGHTLVQEHYAELLKTLRKFINDIASVCPRMLKIIDCCYAEAVADLLEMKLGDSSHVEWHVEWLSCCQKQESNIEGNQMSAFTDAMFWAVKGGTEGQCPFEADSKICLDFRKSFRENGCVSVGQCHKFVKELMRLRQQKTQEGPSDIQTSLRRGTIIDEPYISFFNRDPMLYTFYFESMFDKTIHKFETNDLDITNIWRMIYDHRLKNAHHLKVFEHYSMQLLGEYYVGSKDMLSTSDKRILEAASKDNKCILVKIPKYTFYFQSTCDGEVKEFETDDLRISNIWHITHTHWPRNTHHLKLFEYISKKPLGDYYVDGKDVPSTDVTPIVEALSNDQYLLVEIDDTLVENKDYDVTATDVDECQCSDTPIENEDDDLSSITVDANESSEHSPSDDESSSSDASDQCTLGWNIACKL